MENLYELITTKRKELGLSLREAAKKIGISHSYLSTLEKGMDPRTNAPIKPTPETLNLISNAYNLHYEQLMELAGYWSCDRESLEIFAAAYSDTLFSLNLLKDLLKNEMFPYEKLDNETLEMFFEKTMSFISYEFYKLEKNNYKYNK